MKKVKYIISDISLAIKLCCILETMCVVLALYDGLNCREGANYVVSETVLVLGHASLSY